MSETLKEWEFPTVSELRVCVDKARTVFEKQRSRGSIAGGRIYGTLAEILNLDNLSIIGDIHGDYECLAQILCELDYEEFLANEMNKIVFLGDYIDRGNNSIGVLNLVCELKAKYPDSVVLMRGNHEAPSEFPFNSHDFPFQLVENYGESAGQAIYRESLPLFKSMIIATVVASRILLVHGGLPTDPEALQNYRITLSDAQNKHLANRVLEELLWNDPRQINSIEGWEYSGRGIGRYFGEEITARWLNASGTVCVVRGHEPCQGYKIDHDGRVLTLFSSRRPYSSFKAAYLSIRAADLQTIRNANDLVPYIKFPKS